MSRAAIERACFDLKESANVARFRKSPEEFLGAYSLTGEERTALMIGDLAYLYRTDTALFALDALAKALGYDRKRYVTQLRNGLGLAECPEQMRVLSRREG